MGKKYFRCQKCGHDLFEDKGLFDYARVQFRGLKCLKCGNDMLVQVESKRFKGYLLKLSDNCEQKLGNL